MSGPILNKEELNNLLITGQETRIYLMTLGQFMKNCNKIQKMKIFSKSIKSLFLESLFSKSGKTNSTNPIPKIGITGSRLTL